MGCSPPSPFVQTCGPVKRKRRDGGDMAREYVDPETGEVYNVETTRDAKKRHKQTGGQWQPTIGQINAADIRNRQDAKIKKDKENAEKRKKQQERQVAKEAQLKKFQQERLAKGRISVEDTWGKVSASQNRLNKFFAAPRDVASNDSKPQEHAEEETEAVNGHEDPEGDGEFVNRHHAEGYKPVEERGESNDVQPVEEQTNIANDTSTLMLPPQQPYIRSPKSKRIASSPLSPAKEDSAAEPHTPSPKSAEATSPESHKISSSPTSKERLQPISPQVIEDTLAGLATQDLMDDFEIDDANPETEDSEVTSEAIQNAEGDLESLSQTLGRLSWPSSMASPDLTEKNRADLIPAVCESSNPRNILEQPDDRTSEDIFSDDGVEDDDLLALATTQQPKLRPSLNSQGDESSAGFTAPLSPTPRKRFGRSFSKHQVSPTGLRVPGGTTFEIATQSFDFGDLSNEDLVQCITEFERADSDGAFNSASSMTAASPRQHKRRRILPWDKHPVAMQLSPTAEHHLTPSPPDYFDD